MAFFHKRRGNSNRRYQPMRRLPRNFKKFHKDEVELEHLHHHHHQRKNDFHKTKPINKRQGRRIGKKIQKKNKDGDQLDREMREYWIKSGQKKGKEEGNKDQNLAVKKMNEEMDDYWKSFKSKKNPETDKKDNNEE